MQYCDLGNDATPLSRRTAVVDRLIARLEAGPWLMGCRFTAAGILLCSPNVYLLEATSDHAAMRDWVNRCTSRAAIVAAQEAVRGLWLSWRPESMQDGGRSERTRLGKERAAWTRPAKSWAPNTGKTVSADPAGGSNRDTIRGEIGALVHRDPPAARPISGRDRLCHRGFEAPRMPSVLGVLRDAADAVCAPTAHFRSGSSPPKRSACDHRCRAGMWIRIPGQLLPQLRVDPWRVAWAVPKRLCTYPKPLAGAARHDRRH